MFHLNKSAVQSVEISAIAHATDDLEKVESALAAVLPNELRGREIFTRRYLEGHHRNPIVTFASKLTEPAEVEAFTSHLFHQLSKNERLRIEGGLPLYTDPEGNLYLRISKQKAFQGTIELNEDDPIRVKLKFNRLMGAPAKLMQQLLEAL